MEKNTQMVPLRILGDILQLPGLSSRAYRTLKEKGVLRPAHILPYVIINEVSLKILSHYSRKASVQIEQAVQKYKEESEKAPFLLDLIVRIGAEKYYRTIYNHLRRKNAVIKGKLVRLKKDSLPLLQSYLKKKDSEAAQRLSDIYKELPSIPPDATQNTKERYKKATSDIAYMEKVVDLSFRQEKVLVRKLVIDLATKHNPISLLCFPGPAWFFERDLIIETVSRIRISQIVALEKNRDIYEFMLLNQPPAVCPIKAYRITDYEFAKNPPADIEPFNVVWLDYMGPFDFKKLSTFKFMLENKMVKLPATIVFTFQAGNESEEVLKYYMKNSSINPKRQGSRFSYKALRLDALPRIYVRAAAQYGIHAYKVIIKEYIEPIKDCHHVPMVLVALRLEQLY